MAKPTGSFERKVPVPGLVDLAKPAFIEVGKPSTLREAFWYRRTFVLKGALREVAKLKVHKACYGTQVWLNGRLLGDHLPSFTPGWFDVRDALKAAGQENELIIRVGAHREALPPGMPTGWDFEKYLYTPGIYDSVELVLAERPFVVNVQTVPDLEKGAVRVVAEVDGGENSVGRLVAMEIAEVRSGRVVARSQTTLTDGAGPGWQTLDATIRIPSVRPWSPEDPFLYRLRLSTGSDEVQVRFGMRSFGFDPVTRRALLNGKPYYLRGSNVTLYRFFEDAERGELPWNRDWVRKLHRKVRGMNWNALRYCIGFPPEFWYDIADEEGILIQDEFPIWLLGGQRDRCPEWPVAEKIIPEYREWMRERWNHPSVVIWDAQNESNTPETGRALGAVRALDLSQRPWDNGWAEPQAPTDCVEAHPYLFIRNYYGGKPFRMDQMPGVSGLPDLQAAQKKLSVPIIINEYAWLWLTRDGQPTCLTDKVYADLLGPDSTVKQRRQVYARYLAAKTEFWRAHRECAGVLHFCVLGYSRPGDKPRPEGGATSDHWLNVKGLKLEPLFERYLRDAFNPLGVMLDFWDESIPAGGPARPLRVFLVNDLDQPWSGPLRLVLRRGSKRVATQSLEARVDGLGRDVFTMLQEFPAEAGHYTLVAELRDSRGRLVRSEREFDVQP